MQQVQRYGRPTVEIFLVGNKVDDVAKRVVEYQEMENLCDELGSNSGSLKKTVGINYMETSAKIGKGVDELFFTLTRGVLDKMKAQTEKTKLIVVEPKKKSKKCLLM